MQVDRTERFPKINLCSIDLPRCPKCNSLLKRIVDKKNSGKKTRYVWGCLGWHTHIHCRTQYEDSNGTPDYDQELIQTV